MKPLRFMRILCAALLVLQTGLLVQAEETREISVDPLKLTVPKSWKQQQPANRLRLAQFEIPAAEGDSESAELVISGPFGGSVAENVRRWVNQFNAEGRKSVLTQGESEQGKYIFVDVIGTYQKPDGPPILQRTVTVTGYQSVSVMLLVPNKGNYFLKLTGPQKTVTAALDAYRASFGGDASKETPYEAN